MENRKKKNVENAQKKTEENQNISLQQKTNTNGISNGENKKQQQQKYQAYIENGKMENVSSSLISNYFKCKLIKISNQKTQIGRMCGNINMAK